MIFSEPTSSESATHFLHAAHAQDATCFFWDSNGQDSTAPRPAAIAIPRAKVRGIRPVAKLTR